MPNQESSDYLQKVYNAQSTEELEKVYDQWAEGYDRDVTGLGYNSPAVAAGFFARYVQPSTVPILDAGAGTGLMGEVLHAMGYNGLVGIDLSPGMLKMAEKRNAYQELRRMVLGEHLDFPDNHFGACQSVGVFTAGHAPTSGFDEIVRVVKPGGYVIFSLLVDVYEKKGFKEKLEALAAGKKWQLVEMSGSFSCLPHEDPGIKQYIFAYQVL